MGKEKNAQIICHIIMIKHILLKKTRQLNVYNIEITI